MTISYNRGMDSPAPRRRFQFHLRTLMIGVTLLAVACGYVGWQAKILRERRALLMKVRIAHGEWWTREDVNSPLEKSGIGISVMRRMLGDHEYGVIMVPKRFPRDDEDRI